MNQSQRVLVAGIGISDIATAKLVLRRGGDVVLYDDNAASKEEDIGEKFDRGAKINMVLGEIRRSDPLGMGLYVISPGIPLDSPFVSVVDDAEIPILEEIGLAYQCGLGKLTAITGTSGKTTTTALTGEVLKARYEKTSVVGDIGDPYTSRVLEMTEDSVAMAEVSSFQPEIITDFKPNTGVILDITPGHLNRHDTMKNYIRTKECITLSQIKEDAVVLNYDDSVPRELGQNPGLKPRVIWFSGRETLKGGLCMDGDNTAYCQSGHQTVVVNVHDMQLLGRHDYENTMAAAAIALEMGVSMSDITGVIEGFHPVEHRVEFVRECTGVRYYNDSKGTDPDAAIQTLRAILDPTLLIAGGYDKDSGYDEWMSELEGKVRYLVLIGQTRDRIAECAKKRGFAGIMYAGDIQETVQVYAVYTDIGDHVLLSPACASWGMFKNYEERGRILEEYVIALQEVNTYGGEGAGGSRTL